MIGSQGKAVAKAADAAFASSKETLLGSYNNAAKKYDTVAAGGRVLESVGLMRISRNDIDWSPLAGPSVKRSISNMGLTFATPSRDMQKGSSFGSSYGSVEIEAFRSVGIKELGQRIQGINKQLEALYSGYNIDVDKRGTRSSRGQGIYSNVATTLGLESRPLGVTASGKSILGE